MKRISCWILSFLFGMSINSFAQKDTIVINVKGAAFTMIKVQGGTFTMGNNSGDYESPAHKVTLSSYYIGETEVTQLLWWAVMGEAPSLCGSDKNLPVECVSWEDCQSFIDKLNELTGRQFRLPTEAEWEFAARGGIKSKGYKFSGSNSLDEVAWFASNHEDQTQLVATKAPNELGLYDMTGNVYEWCQDRFGKYEIEDQTNPKGATSGNSRVVRGGCHYDFEEGCVVTKRDRHAPDYGNVDVGLRLAL